MSEADIDTDRIDEAVLALMFLTSHKDRECEPWRAWKSFDWNAIGRLQEKELILDPVGKAKAVVLTEEGHRRSKEAYHRLFAKRDDRATAGN